MGYTPRSGVWVHTPPPTLTLQNLIKSSPFRSRPTSSFLGYVMLVRWTSFRAIYCPGYTAQRPMAIHRAAVYPHTPLCGLSTRKSFCLHSDRVQFWSSSFSSCFPSILVLVSSSFDVILICLNRGIIESFWWSHNMSFGLKNYPHVLISPKCAFPCRLSSI